MPPHCVVGPPSRLSPDHAVNAAALDHTLTEIGKVAGRQAVHSGYACSVIFSPTFTVGWRAERSKNGEPSAFSRSPRTEFSHLSSLNSSRGHLLTPSSWSEVRGSSRLPGGEPRG